MLPLRQTYSIAIDPTHLEGTLLHLQVSEIMCGSEVMNLRVIGTEYPVSVACLCDNMYICMPQTFYPQLV